MGHLETRAAFGTCCTEMQRVLALLAGWDLHKSLFSLRFRLWVFPGSLPVGTGPPLPVTSRKHSPCWPRHRPISHFQDPLRVRLKKGSGNPEHVFLDLGRASGSPRSQETSPAVPEPSH